MTLGVAETELLREELAELRAALAERDAAIVAKDANLATKDQALAEIATQLSITAEERAHREGLAARDLHAARLGRRPPRLIAAAR